MLSHTTPVRLTWAYVTVIFLKTSPVCYPTILSTLYLEVNWLHTCMYFFFYLPLFDISFQKHADFYILLLNWLFSVVQYKGKQVTILWNIFLQRVHHLYEPSLEFALCDTTHMDATSVWNSCTHCVNTKFISVKTLVKLCFTKKCIGDMM